MAPAAPTDDIIVLPQEMEWIEDFRREVEKELAKPKLLPPQPALPVAAWHLEPPAPQKPTPSAQSVENYAALKAEVERLSQEGSLLRELVSVLREQEASAREQMTRFQQSWDARISSLETASSDGNSMLRTLEERVRTLLEQNADAGLKRTDLDRRLSELELARSKLSVQCAVLQDALLALQKAQAKAPARAGAPLMDLEHRLEASIQAMSEALKELRRKP